MVLDPQTDTAAESMDEVSQFPVPDMQSISKERTDSLIKAIGDSHYPGFLIISFQDRCISWTPSQAAGLYFALQDYKVVDLGHSACTGERLIIDGLDGVIHLGLEEILLSSEQRIMIIGWIPRV